MWANLQIKISDSNVRNPFKSLEMLRDSQLFLPVFPMIKCEMDARWKWNDQNTL